VRPRFCWTAPADTNTFESSDHDRRDDRYRGILASAPGAGALAGAEEQVMTAAELKESHVDIADAARRELAGH